MKKVSVIGIGRLGLCFSLTLEKGGYDVVGCDIRQDYVDNINRKTYDSVEPYVNEYLKKAKNFIATTNIKKTIEHSDIIFITVRTTSLLDGSYDCSQVDNVINSIKECGKIGDKEIVISCNVNPGYSDEINYKLKDYNYKVSYNPEWVAQGTIIHDQIYPDLVVIGEDNKISGNKIEELYKNICKSNPKIHRMNRLSAELTKISLNCYLTTKISLANMIGDVAVKSGVNPDIILNAIGDDKRIGNKYIKYGFGYGGPCFGRDTRAFIKYSSDINANSSIIESVEEVNKEHLKFQIDNFIKNNPDKNKEVVIDSITYKPGVNIIEESQQLLFAVKLARLGYKVTIQEYPEVISQVKDIYGDLFIYKEVMIKI